MGEGQSIGLWMWLGCINTDHFGGNTSLQGKHGENEEWFREELQYVPYLVYWKLHCHQWWENWHHDKSQFSLKTEICHDANFLIICGNGVSYCYGVTSDYKVGIRTTQFSMQWTQWGMNKMAAILQTTFSNGFSSVEMFVSWFTFHCPRGLTDNKSSMVQVNTRGPFYWHGSTLIPAGISNHIHNKVWDEITYPFPNFDGCTAEVWEWISNCNPHSSGHVITYPCSDSGDQFTHALQDSSLALEQSSGYSSAFEFILCE